MYLSVTNIYYLKIITKQFIYYFIFHYFQKYNYLLTIDNSKSNLNKYKIEVHSLF